MLNAHYKKILCLSGLVAWRESAHLLEDFDYMNLLCIDEQDV